MYSYTYHNHISTHVGHENGESLDFDDFFDMASVMTSHSRHTWDVIWYHMLEEIHKCGVLYKKISRGVIVTPLITNVTKIPWLEKGYFKK